ncbi:uncharacterized protein [Triticum aestivum]|uniref:uncharacterized protein n=1 Tax=Triticum aestivum TaxID=4565 RepID=UPI001D034B31|nr:uncharacterized protein LOC123148536 [Triticum aestivum]
MVAASTQIHLPLTPYPPSRRDPASTTVHGCDGISGSTTPRPPLDLHDRASPMLGSPHPALHRYGLVLFDPMVPCWTRAPRSSPPSMVSYSQRTMASPGTDAWAAVLAGARPSDVLQCRLQA